MTLRSRSFPVAVALVGLPLVAWSMDGAPVVSSPTPEARLAGVAQVVDGSEVGRAARDVLATHAEIRDQAIRPWADAWLGGRGASVRPGAKGPAWSKQSGGRSVDGIAQRTWKAGVAPWAAGEKALLANYASLADVDLHATRVVRDGDRATLDVDFDLRGTTPAGARRTDRGTLAVELVREGGTWSIASASLVKGEALVADRAPSFADVTEAAGLDLAVQPRSEAIRRGGYAAAAGDVDGDGLADLVLGADGPVRILRNTGSGFVDVTATSGVRSDTRVKSAAIVDLDNDGHRDLALVRFVRKGEGSDFVAYRNKGDGTFELKGDVLAKSRAYDRAMPIAAADLDGNGYVDLYLGFPGSRDFTNPLRPEDRPSDLNAQGVWFNDGSWSFREVAAEQSGDLGLRSRSVYPHAALVADLNRDGRPDILVTDDSGRASPIYFQQDDGSFADTASEHGLAHNGWGMGATVGDFDGDGHNDVFTTGIDLRGLRRLAASLPADAPESLKTAVAQMHEGLRANHLFRNKGDGTFEEVTAQAGLDFTGAAPAVAEWFDYNADGHLDLYVPNGLWSGGGQEIEDVFLTSALAAMGAAGANPERRAEGWSAVDGEDAYYSNPMFARFTDPDPNPMLTVLRGFRGELSNPLGASVSDVPTLSFSGHERNRLFRNNGDGTFTEVGWLEGVDRIEDGYVSVMMDANGDGRQDLVLRNCDPAPGHPADAFLMLRNERPSDRVVTVSLVSAAGVPDVVGAMLEAKVGGRTLVREIRGASGAVQHEPVAVFGLGQAAKIDELTIRFPSGAVQKLSNVEPGKVVVREGQGTVAAR